jgi:hypothetical protein
MAELKALGCRISGHETLDLQERKLINTEPAEHRPLRIFVLDLLYPAVLGALIVFLFIRLAKSNLLGLTEPTTHFGIILVVFYAFGFLFAKLSSKYSPGVAFVDCFSSALMFVCFYILGLSEETIPHATNYRYFYGALLVVVLSPPVRRAILLGGRPHFRNALAILTALLVAVALLAEILYGPPQWLTPPTVAALLYLLLLIYFIHVCSKGIVTE